MKSSLKALLVAATLAVPAVPAIAQDSMEMGQSMLVGALVNSLNRFGISTDNVDQLTLAEIAEIRGIVNDDSMGDNNKRSQIENVLETAGGN